MKRARVNGTDINYIDIGQGPPLVCVHGSLCDYRIWSPVLGPLSTSHRVITPSLRHFFPEHWSGVGGKFTIAQHVADMIAFIEALELGPVHLLGQSRGGHIAFRVAQQRPDLLRKLILAEPGGELDDSLDPTVVPQSAAPSARAIAVREGATKIAAGDVDGGLELFVNAINGDGVWQRLPAASKQETRDNAQTLLGQMNEQRQPFTRAEAESIRAPTLFIGGGLTKGPLLAVLRALAAHVPGARVEMIAGTGHMMFVQDPVRFSAVVLDFLDDRISG